MDDNSELLTMW